jgi:serine/threonine-protein kinase
MTLGIALPPPLAALLRRVLAKSADDRPQSAEDFAQALAGAAETVVDPNATVIAPRPVPPPTRRGEWDDRVLQHAESELARHVGPVARVLVRKAAETTANIGELYATLAPNIHDPSARTLFASRGQQSVMRTAPAAASGAARISPEQIAAAQEALTFYVGPIARVLVKRALNEATSTQDFYARMAAHIEREEDRSAFRRTLARDWGPSFSH